MLFGMSHVARSRHAFTYADFLAHEEASSDKHEFLDGDIYAMAGGTPEHAALSVAASTLLSNQLATSGPCRVFSSDLRVRVMATNLVTYPDVTVVCGPLERDPESRVTVVNPTLLVEVTSDGTEDWDRGEKRENYQQIPSLKEIVVVSHRAPVVEVWRRDGGGSWASDLAKAGEEIRLTSIGCVVRVDDLYRRAGWSPPPNEPAR
jgi:Uma2 family endonuclease